MTRILPNYYLANDPGRSQWISQVGDLSALPEQVTYTFRTTFDLTGALPDKALLCGKFLADDHVNAIRLNGRKVDVPGHGYEWPFVNWHEFKAAGGFVAGKNVLEIDVFNGNPDIIKAATQMALPRGVGSTGRFRSGGAPAVQNANAAVTASGLAGDGRRMPLPAKVGVLDLLDIVAGDAPGASANRASTRPRASGTPPFRRPTATATGTIIACPGTGWWTAFSSPTAARARSNSIPPGTPSACRPRTAPRMGRSGRGRRNSGRSTSP